MTAMLGTCLDQASSKSRTQRFGRDDDLPRWFQIGFQHQFVSKFEFLGWKHSLIIFICRLMSASRTFLKMGAISRMRVLLTVVDA